MVEELAAHLPVMLDEVLECLAIEAGGFYVDCTFGRGGHSKAILSRLNASGRLLALDKDPSAIEAATASGLTGDGRLEVVHGAFTHLAGEIDVRGCRGQVSGVLMDLGVSSPQLDEAERGFSFMRSGPLDMRMDTTQGPTAAEWLNTVDESELVRVLREYGEERFAKRIASAIVRGRPLSTTGELAEMISSAVPTRERNKHPATRSFQAIRIAVNRELDELSQALQQALEVLKPGGRLVVISFHSLEDRIVKRFMREQEKGVRVPAHLPLLEEHKPRLRSVCKAITPSEREMAANPRARSAILRCAERTAA
jgi:16S rRNA (cytosine1402-N4)-methyltransferase